MKEENRMAVLTWLVGGIGGLGFPELYPYNVLFWIPHLFHWIKYLRKGYEVEE